MSAATMWATILLGSGVVAAPSGKPSVSVTVSSASGPVGAALTQRVVHNQLGRLTACYQRGAFKRTGKRTGQLGLDLGIMRSGGVRFARIRSDGLHHATTAKCVLAVVRSLRFPKAPRSSRATVSLRFRVLAAVQATLNLAGWVAERGIDVAMVRRVIRAHHGQFLGCFKRRARRVRGAVVGTVKLRLRVTPKGRAAEVSARGGTLRMPVARTCIERMARLLRFPKPPRKPVWIGAQLYFRKH